MCQRSGFTPRIVREADGAATALAFVAAGLGVALVSEPIKKFQPETCCFQRFGGATTGKDTAWGRLEEKRTLFRGRFQVREDLEPSLRPDCLTGARSLRLRPALND